MRSLRVSGKTIGFLFLTLGAALCWLVCAALGLTHWRGRLFRTWAKTMVWLFGLRLRVTGVPPKGPCLLVANHLSYVDVIVLAAQFDCLFVAKSEIATWPLFGFLSRWMNTIFIDRQRKRDLLRVNALLTEALAAGQTVVIFPEGTTTGGAAVLPFKSGLLEPAVRTGRGVAYASLSYRTDVTEAPASEAVCWWGEMEFVPHLLKLFALPSFTGALVFGAAPLRANDRKVLAKQLHVHVTDGFAVAQRLLESHAETMCEPGAALLSEMAS